MKKNITKNTSILTLLMYLIASNGVQAIVDDDSINNSQEQTEKVINENYFIDNNEDEPSENKKGTFYNSDENNVLLNSKNKEDISNYMQTKVTTESQVIANEDSTDNYVLNGDFTNGINNWTINGETSSANVKWIDDEYEYGLNYWMDQKLDNDQKPTMFNIDTYQTLVGLEKGSYELSFYVNSGEFNELYAYVKDGELVTKKEISPSGNMTKVTLQFQAKSNNLTMGFYGKGASGLSWANFDNVEINKAEVIDNTGKIINPDFEYNLDGWETTGTSSIVKWNGDWGNSNTKGCLNYGWYDGDGEYETDTHQTITGLENGTYTVKAYAQSSGEQKELYFYAKVFDKDNKEKIVRENITDAHNFRITLLEVEVTNGQMTIGFYAKGGMEEWANFDEITISKKSEDKRKSLDVIENFTFEDGLKGWNVIGNKDSVQALKGSGYNDSSYLKFEDSKSYEGKVEQTITGLENGHYKLEFYAKSNGGQQNIYGYVKDTGKSEARTSVPVDNNYRKVVVDFEVLDGQATIGFYSKSSNYSWSIIDNVKLYKVNEGYTMLKGGDLTELNYVESTGAVFYDQDGNPRDPFHILAENGFNFARLRIYNKTGRDSSHKYEDGSEFYLPDGYQNKEDMLKLAKRAKDVNMQIELTLHYSDWWTNGLVHDIPVEWEEAIKGLDEEEAVSKLEGFVYDFTYDVMKSLKDQGTLPEYISLGNEMQGGLLYPFGKVDNMETLAKFLNAGAKAVRDVSDTTKIILHLDEAGDNNRYYKLLDGCEEYNVDYDIIGPSYYPYWTRNSVEQIIPWCNDLYAKYGKKIIFMETGYNWNPTVPDGSKPGQLVDNGNESHASTPQGQKEFMDELFNGMRNADDNCIVGDLYWDPIMINHEGIGWAIAKGAADDGSEDIVDENVVSNTTLFDFNGKALKSLNSYKDNTEGTNYGMISGIITDSKGNIIDNAEVTVSINGDIYKRTSDKYGRFFINNLKETDDGTIVVTRTGYISANDKFKIKSGEISSIELSLKKKSSSSSGGSSSGNRDSSTIQDNSVDSSNTLSNNITESEGKIVINENGNKEIWINGEKKVNAWVEIDGKWYRTGEAGEVIKGWIKDNDSWYYLNNEGDMRTGWLNDNNKWYYLNKTGNMNTGWFKEDEKWYYLNESGEMKTGWLNKNDKWYYLGEAGDMRTGWVKDGSLWYYLNDDGSMKTGWINSNDNWYYLDESGKMIIDSIIDGYKINSQGELFN